MIITKQSLQDYDLTRIDTVLYRKNTSIAAGTPVGVIEITGKEEISKVKDTVKYGNKLIDTKGLSLGDLLLTLISEGYVCKLHSGILGNIPMLAIQDFSTCTVTVETVNQIPYKLSTDPLSVVDYYLFSDNVQIPYAIKSGTLFCDTTSKNPMKLIKKSYKNVVIRYSLDSVRTEDKRVLDYGDPQNVST
jgi:hypothetical protein